MQLQNLAAWLKKLNLPFVIISAGVCLVLFWIGLKKFTPSEAQGIYPFIINSPFVSWTYYALGKQGASDFIGIFEWLTATCLVLGNFRPAIGMVGSIFGMLIFLLTTTFFITTPNMVATVDNIWGPTPTGEFILKDITLFGACAYLLTWFGDKRALLRN